MPKKNEFDYDLIVIGSGAGGSAGANIAAEAGKRVAVIEADTFGGDSPNWSDVPVKALLHAAQLYDEARHGARFGLRASTLGYNYPSLRAWKDLVVKRTGAGGNRRYYETKGISTFHGQARFISPNELTVNRRHLSARNFLIATGSEWTVPDVQGLRDVPFHTPRTILESVRPPKSLFVIGGGTSGVEIAQLMAIFGTKVFIAEMAGQLLPREDAVVGSLIERRLKESKGVTSLTQTRILSVVKDGLQKRVTFSRGQTTRSVKVDEILVATGRAPRVDIGLENAHVKFSGHGIDVNDHLQTSSRHIYAAGDVLGRKGQTYSALMESRTAAHNILRRNKITPDYTAIPRLAFTSPGIASVGLSEKDCLRRDMSINQAVAPLNTIVRSNTSDFRDGFVKIITNKKDVVIGATVVAPHAAEIIHELALAVKYELTASELAATPHAFLSWSEAVRVAAARLVK